MPAIAILAQGDAYIIRAKDTEPCLKIPLQVWILPIKSELCYTGIYKKKLRANEIQVFTLPAYIKSIYR